MARPWVSFAFAAASCVIAARPAQATLGGNRDSIDTDSRHFSARVSATAASTHTVHVRDCSLQKL